MRRLILSATLCLLIPATALLAACSQQADSPDAMPSQTADPAAVINAPKFSGPHAERFLQEFLGAPSDDIREILRDEKITDAEVQAIGEKLRTCLSAKGVQVKGFNDDGGYEYSIDPSIRHDQADDAVEQCELQSGVPVIGLYHQVRTNPTNKDRLPEILACLHRSKQVPESFTLDDFRNAMSDIKALPIEMKLAWAECDGDPNGAFKN